MVKTRATAEARMRRNVVGAGASLKEGFAEAPDPLDILLADPDMEKKHAAGVAEAHRKGKMRGGLKVAKGRDAWRTSQDRAAAHFEERVDDMVKHSMEKYDERANCVETVKKMLAKEPKTTRDQKIAYAGKYQKLVGECYDRIYGRSG